jgi:peptidoglycan/LPS O-acetylase OafA/YrhL
VSLLRLLSHRPFRLQRNGVEPIPQHGRAAEAVIEKSYNTRIEALRGLAALTVAGAHAGGTVAFLATGVTLAFGADEGLNAIFAAIYRLLLNAHGAVVIFFVISGHVLRLSLDRAGAADSRLAGTFLLRRVLRLLPPVAFMVLAFDILYHASGYRFASAADSSYTPASLARHALLLDSSVNGVVWTLQIEALAAPVILALWFAQRRWGSAVLWVAALLLGGLSFADGFDRWAMRELHTPWNFFLYIYAFVAGMLVTDWCAVLARTPIPRFGGLYVGFCGLIVMGAWFVIGGHFRVIAEVLASVGVVAGLAMGFGGLVPRLLDTAIVRFYGRISYSFYLLHPLTIAFVWADRPGVDALLAAGVPAFVVAFLLFLATTAVITPLAWLSYRLVEVPAIKLSRQFGSRRPAMPLRLDPAKS